MKEWQIWIEGSGGWSGTEGKDTSARLVGAVSARTFQEACDEYFRRDPLCWVNTAEGRQYYHNYDPKKLTYWGLKLHDNEGDACNAICGS